MPGRGPKVMFSALDAAAADQLEHEFAAAGHIVLSNARSHRMDPLVPLLIPEVNAEHLAILAEQRRQSGWAGAIVTNPNCAAIVLAMALAPLRTFDIRRVLVTTMQAVSGAGYPGVPSLDILGNVIPYIGGGEEDKIETRDGQDPRQRRRPRAASGGRERASQSRAGDRRALDDGVGRARVAAGGQPTSSPRCARFAGGRRSSGCRPRRIRRSS